MIKGCCRACEDSISLQVGNHDANRSGKRWRKGRRGNLKLEGIGGRNGEKKGDREIGRGEKKS